MKRIITFICVLGALLYLTDFNTYAQGRSAGRGPSVTGGQSHETHGPDVDHGKSADHRQDADHAKAHSGGDTKDSHKDTTVADRIERDSALNAKVTSMLPAGTDLKTASAGFKNQGQFIAALHVSKNLNIPFTDLKAKMTGSNHESLGQAIHDLKPGISEQDAKKEVENAERQAKVTEKPQPVS